MKELLACWYRKALQGETGSSVPCLSHGKKAQRGCQSAGEATQQETPAGRDGLTMSFAWLLPDAAFWAAHHLAFHILVLNGGQMCSKWCKARAQCCSQGCYFIFLCCRFFAMFEHSFSSISPQWFSVKFAVSLTSLGKTAGSPGFKDLCVLLAWGQRALRLFAGPGVPWGCRPYYHLSQIHLSYSHKSDP